MSIVTTLSPISNSASIQTSEWNYLRTIEKNQYALAALCPLSSNWNEASLAGAEISPYLSYKVTRVFIAVLAVLSIFGIITIYTRKYTFYGKTDEESCEALVSLFTSFTRPTPRIPLNQIPSKGIPGGSSRTFRYMGCFRNSILSLIANSPVLIHKLEMVPEEALKAEHVETYHRTLMELIHAVNNEDTTAEEVETAAELFSASFNESLKIMKEELPGETHGLRPGPGNFNDDTDFLKFTGFILQIADFNENIQCYPVETLSFEEDNTFPHVQDTLIVENAGDPRFYGRDSITVNGSRFELHGVSHFRHLHYVSFVKLESGSWMKFDNATVTSHSYNSHRKGGKTYIYIKADE